MVRLFPCFSAFALLFLLSLLCRREGDSPFSSLSAVYRALSHSQHAPLNQPPSPTLRLSPPLLRECMKLSRAAGKPARLCVTPVVARIAVGLPNTNMQRTSEDPKLMVVAHGGDETVYGALALLTQPARWTVACVTCESAQSFEAFSAVVVQVGATPVRFGLPQKSWEEPELILIQAKLSALLDSEQFTQVVTHGPDGENGNSQHKQTFKVVASTAELPPLLVFAATRRTVPSSVVPFLLQSLGRYSGLAPRPLNGLRCAMHQAVRPCEVVGGKEGPVGCLGDATSATVVVKSHFH